MAVVIRMRRTGRRNRPCYRINVADSRSPRDGAFLETIGQYDPICKDAEKQVNLDLERAKHWLSVGALPSDTVHAIFKGQGIYEGQNKPKPRSRKGRSTVTKTRARRIADKAGRATRKDARRAERVETAKAAKTAAAAEGGDE
jgi:small subunit ribosomal protein S16